MHEREYKLRDQVRAEEQKAKTKSYEERAKKKAEAAKGKTAQPKKKSGGGEPPINLLISLIGNVKFVIKRIHFRIEDDYFNHHRPISFGLMIEEISFNTTDKHWVFSSPLSMQHESKPAE